MMFDSPWIKVKLLLSVKDEHKNDHSAVRFTCQIIFSNFAVAIVHSDVFSVVDVSCAIDFFPYNT